MRQQQNLVHVYQGWGLHGNIMNLLEGLSFILNSRNDADVKQRSKKCHFRIVIVCPGSVTSSVSRRLQI